MVNFFALIIILCIFKNSVFFFSSYSYIVKHFISRNIQIYLYCVCSNSNTWQLLRSDSALYFCFFVLHVVPCFYMYLNDFNHLCFTYSALFLYGFKWFFKFFFEFYMWKYFDTCEERFSIVPENTISIIPLIYDHFKFLVEGFVELKSSEAVDCRFQWELISGY